MRIILTVWTLLFATIVLAQNYQSSTATSHDLLEGLASIEGNSELFNCHVEVDIKPVKNCNAIDCGVFINIYAIDNITNNEAVVHVKVPHSFVNRSKLTNQKSFNFKSYIKLKGQTIIRSLAWRLDSKFDWVTFKFIEYDPSNFNVRQIFECSPVFGGGL